MRLALPTLPFFASEAVGRAFLLRLEGLEGLEGLERRDKKRLDFVAKGLIVKGISLRALALAADNRS